MRDYYDEQIAQLDKALFNEIMPDIVNGTIWEMDDETVEMILTGIWESAEWDHDYMLEDLIQVGYS
jgi:hypothetical protein|tara:strand:+ start:2432 stop:2629 length:198 start_codon:yes stop_codon:yes gene_type:complete